MMVLIPLVLTSLVVAAAVKLWSARSHRTDLGFMSEQWIAECQASQQSV